jgi:hypothetical protein
MRALSAPMERMRCSETLKPARRLPGQLLAPPSMDWQQTAPHKGFGRGIKGRSWGTGFLTQSPLIATTLPPVTHHPPSVNPHHVLPCRHCRARRHRARDPRQGRLLRQLLRRQALFQRFVSAGSLTCLPDAHCSKNGGIGVSIKNPGCLGEAGRGVRHTRPSLARSH